VRFLSSSTFGLGALAIGVLTSLMPSAGRAQTCPSGQIACGNSCVNLSNNLQNCGACGHECASGAVCTAGVCGAVARLAPNPVFACKFTSGKLSGTTDAPTLSGPVNAPCSDNYGSSGAQVTVVFACQFPSGPMAGQTIAPTGGVTLSGPVGQICTDNFGNSGTQVISP
jgi:Stigma-specific protein, Stig1